MSPEEGPGLAVVVVTRDHAAEIGSLLDAVGCQLQPGDEIVIVDNASRDGTAAVARAAGTRATIVETGANLGYAAGCHRGAAASTAPLLLFLNPDAVPGLDALARLREAAGSQPRWGAWQALVTMPGDLVVNTAGNVVHFLGFGWAGSLGRSIASVDPAPREVGFASGAALVVRRSAWNSTGGFEERYFMYGEDLDLCLRLRLLGWGVGIVPAARVTHRYEFNKGAYKWFYLERNRWWTVLAVYPARLLGLLTPALVMFELALLIAAWHGGWLRAKLRAQVAVIASLPAVLRRRRSVQRVATVGDRRFADSLVASLDSPYLAAARTAPGLEIAQRLYWASVRALLR